MRGQPYYNVSYGRKQTRRRHFSILNLIFGILTLAVVIALLLAYIVQWINPAHHTTLLLMLPLIMPILYVANLCCLLYWIVRWKPFAVVPLAVGLLGIGGAALFFKPQLTKEYPGPPSSAVDMKVMTYNTMGMNNRVDGQLVSSMDEIAEAVDSVSPDILCIQEFQSTPHAPKNVFDSKINQLQNSRIQYKINTGNGNGWGLAVYTRFPILKTGYIDFTNSSNSAIWCDIVLRSDTVRVFNAHLQTTSVTASDQEFINNMDFVSDTTRSTKFKNIYHKLLANYSLRAVQADTLKNHINNSPYKVIVCGDFNDTPMSYVYHKIRKGLNDAYKSTGHGPSYTYKGFFNLLRIDYVMYSDGLDAKEYSAPFFECSDHKPVVVTFRM